MDYEISDGTMPEAVHALRKTKTGRQKLVDAGLSAYGHKVFKGRTLSPFVAWDGEGITIGTENNSPHHYILFGCSTGNYIQGPSLSTADCLNLLLKVKRENPKTISVAFAFGYDVEKILCDIPEFIMKRLHETTKCKWRRFRIGYIKGKYFQVSTRDTTGKFISLRVWDIWSFFRASFVRTIEQYLGDVPHLAQIIAGKKERRVFKYEDLNDMIKPYWRLELSYTVQLMEHFRNLLHEADLPIAQWHGPGAVANTLFLQYRTEIYMNRNLPDALLAASCYGFAAGRFESYKIGRACRQIWKYDINSAHPATITKLPSLRGEWHYVNNQTEIWQYIQTASFGIYHVEYDSQFDNSISVLQPQPFYKRDRNNLVSYPLSVDSWRWTPEIVAALPTMTEMLRNKYFNITEAWILEDDGTRPFEWVQDKYRQRKEWQRANNQAQYALKLALNSLFGKFAQKAGWLNSGKIPRWHQLEWAGYITSGTRAILWPALWDAYNKDALIAVDTDSVMSTQPLDLPVSKMMGEWDLEIWDDLIFLQNGIYLYHDNDGWHSKYRGLDPDSFGETPADSVDHVMRYLEKLDLREPYSLDSSTTYGPLRGHTTRFIGSKMAFHSTHPERRGTWETREHDVHFGQKGKREHDTHYCKYCRDDYTPPSETLHELRISELVEFGPDYPHILPWRVDSLRPKEFPETEELFEM
ncbi:MAG: DNA polymerase [Pseudonocardiaceae bacterium]